MRTIMRMNVTNGDPVIRVVTKLPGEPAAAGEIVPTLGNLQRFVGGYIEAVMKAHGFFGGGTATLVVYGDEEAKLKRPNPAPNLLRPTDKVWLLGPLIAVKIDGRGAEVSMTEAEAAATLELLGRMVAAPRIVQ